MSPNIRTTFILTLFILLFNQLFGQGQLPLNNIKKQIIGLTPSNKHTVIAGLAIGFTAHPLGERSDSLYVQINGLNIELGPFGIIGGIYGTMFGLIGIPDSLNKKINFFNNNGYPEKSDFERVEYWTKVNGISLSFGGITETINTGIIINGLSGTPYKTNGIQISGLLNLQYEFNGILIAGISNKVKKGNGLQIALINNCDKGNVFQIGLFNRIGKKALPFINFSFKKEK